MAELTYSVTEAAEALGISRHSMYNLIHAEGFPTLKVGGRRLVSKEFLAQWVRDQTEKEQDRINGQIQHAKRPRQSVKSLTR